MKGRFAIGAIIGAVAGVVAGFLTAPKAGKETRANLKEKAAELKSDAALRGNTAKNKASSVLDEARQRAEAYKARGERAIDGAKEGFKDKSHKS